MEEIQVMADQKKGKLRVLMFPWLAHGHIYPFVELAKKLIITNQFHFYICSSPVLISSIKSALSEKQLNSIEFVELHLPSLPELPPNMHSTKNLPQHLIPLLFEAFELSSPNFNKILESLKPDLLIYDILQPWAPKLASTLNIPAITLSIFGGMIVSGGIHRDKRPGEDYPFKEIYGTEYMIARVKNSKHNHSPDNLAKCVEASNSIILINSFWELEEKYIDYLSGLLNKKVIPVGPLVQDPPVKHENNNNNLDIMEWLDKKNTESVILVSFGSEYFLSKNEREVIAHGLELSGVNFIWVIRFAEGEEMTLEEALPEGFLERTREKGLFIEGWSPQAKILAHPSTGGFLTHCGWNSVNESIKFGVPIIALPMHLEQPLTARLVDSVGVGVEIIGTKDGTYEAEEIAKKIRQLMVDQSGEAVKKNAKKLKEIIKKKTEEETDELAKELYQLCADAE